MPTCMLLDQLCKTKSSVLSGQADDEGKGDNNAAPKRARFEKRILTQQERCNFCVENPKRPRHLVIAIANFTYMMLPQWQTGSLLPCCTRALLHIAHAG